MYHRFAERKGLKTEELSSSQNPAGGFKEVVFVVSGADAFGQLKFESGVHRVQRVPKTEASGRIHTSAASVAVLPEAEEVEVEIAPDDLKIEVYRSSGPGGQSVNTTDSAVKITHLPTGIIVSCQDEKSQLKNKNKALKVLRARLYDKLQAEQKAERDAARAGQIGSGDRSAKIRTYNFPQGRVTDHRIGLSLYRLEEILDGDFEKFIRAIGPCIAAGRAGGGPMSGRSWRLLDILENTSRFFASKGLENARLQAGVAASRSARRQTPRSLPTI